MLKLSQEQHTIHHTDNRNEKKDGSLPTRQQLRALLQAKGVDPNQLDYMTYSDQIRLTKEYCQILGCW